MAKENVYEKKKIPGVNYLHRHPGQELKTNLDPDHVIVDKEDWEEIIYLLTEYPELKNLLGKKRTPTSIGC